MRETAVRTAGAAMPSGASKRTSAATGARPPRGRRWSPYRSKRAERACMPWCTPSSPPGTGTAGTGGNAAHCDSFWIIPPERCHRIHSPVWVCRCSSGKIISRHSPGWPPGADVPEFVRVGGAASTRGKLRGDNMAAMKPRTGDGPLEVTKEGRGIVMRVPLEGGGRLVVEMTPDEANALGDALKSAAG